MIFFIVHVFLNFHLFTAVVSMAIEMTESRGTTHNGQSGQRKRRTTTATMISTRTTLCHPRKEERMNTFLTEPTTEEEEKETRNRRSLTF